MAIKDTEYEDIFLKKPESPLMARQKREMDKFYVSKVQVIDGWANKELFLNEGL